MPGRKTWSFDIDKHHQEVMMKSDESAISQPVNVYFEVYYPNPVPPSDIARIIQSVLAATDNDQRLWWRLIELWAIEKGSDLEWRRATYNLLKTEQTQRLAMQSCIDNAKKIFHGQVMHVVS